MNLESFPGTLPVHTTNEEVRKREDLLNAIDVTRQTILFGRYHLVLRSTNPSNIAFAISLFVPIANLLPHSRERLGRFCGGSWILKLYTAPTVGH